MVSPDGGPTELTYELVRLPDRHYTFSGTLLHADESVIIVDAQVTPSKPLIVDGREVIGAGYRAVWFLFNGKPWDLGRFYRPDGQFTGFYADVLEPVRWRGDDPNSLAPLVDLFLDLWISTDGTPTVLDEDEFQEAIEAGAIGEEQVSHARSVISELLEGVHAGRFPPSVVREFTG